MSVRKHRKIGGRYHWSNCLLFDYEFLLRWMTAGYSSLTFNAYKIYIEALYQIPFRHRFNCRKHFMIRKDAKKREREDRQWQQM